MKSENQILRQLSELKIPRSDRAKMSKFLKGIGVKSAEYSKEDNGIPCSYEDFLDWYKNGKAAGDIVGCGRSAVIVSFAFKGIVKYCGYFGLDKELYNTEDGVPQEVAEGACEDVKLSDKEIEDYRQNYLTSGYVVDEKNGVLMSKPKPEAGKIYEFFHDGQVFTGYLRKTRYGKAVFKYRCKDDTLVNEDITVEYHNVMRLLDDAEVKAHNDVLQTTHACCWDDTQKELMVLSQRQEKGKPYFFITENFTVSGAYDWGTSRTNRHYWSGNYFATKEEAASFLNMIKGERIRQIKTQRLSQAVGKKIVI